MRLTYQMLLEYLQTLKPEQLSSDITVKVDDEFFAAASFGHGNSEGILDDEHPFIEVIG